MLKRLCVMAAVMGLTACGVETQAPEDAPVQGAQGAEAQAETTAQNVPVGGCSSYCDGKYCWMCREQPDGLCACILF